MLKVLIYFLLILNFSLTSQIENYAQHRIPCEPTEYLINYHYVKNFKYPLPEYQNDVANLYVFTNELNKLFSPTCIQFKICKIDTIHDYNYFRLKDDPGLDEAKDIVNQYYNPYAINIYWVADYRDQTYKGICEDLNLKPSIFINYQLPILLSIQLFKVQMLQYFGLRSTASIPISSELVNGSNGKITADSLWDTPADPMGLPYGVGEMFLTPYNPYAFFYSTKKDANGEYYNPMIYNLMSIPQQFMKCTELTLGQYQQIIINDRQCRRKRWGL